MTVDLVPRRILGVGLVVVAVGVLAAGGLVTLLWSNVVTLDHRADRLRGDVARLEAQVRSLGAEPVTQTATTTTTAAVPVVTTATTARAAARTATTARAPSPTTAPSSPTTTSPTTTTTTAPPPRGCLPITLPVCPFS